MFTANVYRVIVCSLSGTLEEVNVVRDVVRRWNHVNAERSGKVYMLVEKSAHQDDVDVLIGIVGNWVEKTDVVDAFISAGKKVMLFFNGYHDPKNTILSEEKKVEAFHRAVLGKCHIAEYRGISELGMLVEMFLESE